HRALEDLLHETSQLLARLSRHAAVVVGPQPDQALVRGVQIVRLHERSALLVVVLSNGGIERHVLQVAEEVDDTQLATAARAVEGMLSGRAWGTVPDTRAGVIELATPDHHEPLYVGGVSNLAAEQEAFSTAQSAARLLEMLEH